MNKFFIAVYLTVACRSLFGAQHVSMNPTEVQQVILSNRNHNRIAIIDDRIKKAFFRSNNIAVDVEEVTGQVFIQALRPNCPPTTLSIVTTSGLIQDLELRFVESPTEIILLQPIVEMEFLDCNTVCQNGTPIPFGEEAIRSLVEGIIQGEIPEGYVSIADPEQAKTLCDGLKVQRLSRLVNEEQIVFVYRVQNTSCRNRIITECEVNVLDGDWVFLDRFKLKPEECAVVLIGCLR